MVGASLVEVTASITTSASAPAESAGKPAAPVPQQNRGIPVRGFGAFVTTTTALSAASFRSEETVLTTIVDSAATHNFIDPIQTPRLPTFMIDYRILYVSQTIVGVGENVLEGVVTGVVQDTVADDGGHERIFSFDAILVPGMVSNLFSVTWQKGIATLFYPDKPRLEYDDLALPMSAVPADEVTGKLLCFINVKLGGDSGGPALLSLLTCGTGVWDTSTAKAWMFFGNRRAEYNEDTQACDVCAVGKSEQQDHLKQATYDVQRVFQLVTVDTMGRITPQALGGYNFVTKLVDQHTKRKEIFLTENKTKTVDSLELFNTGLVIPSNLRSVRLKADQDTEFTSSALRQYCRYTGLRLPTNHDKSVRTSGQEIRLLESCAACSPIRV